MGALPPNPLAAPCAIKRPRVLQVRHERLPLVRLEHVLGVHADRMRDLLVARNFSSGTSYRYLRAARAFVAYWRRDPRELDDSHVLRWIVHLRETGTSSGGAKVPLAAVKFLYRYVLLKPEVVDHIPWPRQAKALPDVPSAAEMRELLDAADGPGTRAMLMLGYGAGLRVSEVAQLRVRDIDSKRGVLQVRCGKGRKDRVAPLPPALLEALRDWWRVGRPGHDWLFPGERPGTHLTVNAIQQRFRCVLARTSVRPMTFHTLRHAFATHSLEAGVDVVTIQAMLGHGSLQTTLVYLRVQADRVAEVSNPLQRLTDGVS